MPDVAALHARRQAPGGPCLEAPQPVFVALIAQDQDPDGLALPVSEGRPAR